MELKDSGVNLDRDRFNGRTAVQQCWDYLNALPDCPWGIVSNFVTFRLYHRAKGSQAYEEFSLQELRGDKRFAEFYYIFERGGLVYSWAGRPLRAAALLERTEDRQREVDDKLYDEYSSERRRLIEHLHYKLGNDLETSIYIAQRILDRIIFVAFCEDRDLLREKTLKSVYSTVPPFAKATNPRWQSFLELFRAMDCGHKNMPYLEVGFNGGLFKEDPRIDDLQLDDDWTEFFNHVGDYDFRDEVNVEVLGHLFEKSVAEIEKLRSGGLYGLVGDASQPVSPLPLGEGQGVRAERSPEDSPHPSPLPRGEGTPSAMQKSAERKRFGTYYTPSDFTRLIVEETVRVVVRERFDALLAAHGLSREQSESEKPSPKVAAYWRDCLAALARRQGLRPGLRQRRISHRRLRRLGRRIHQGDGPPDVARRPGRRRPGRRRPQHHPRRQPLRGGRFAAGGRDHAVGPVAAFRPAGQTPGRPVGERGLGEQPRDRPGGPRQGDAVEIAVSRRLFGRNRVPKCFPSPFGRGAGGRGPSIRPEDSPHPSPLPRGEGTAIWRRGFDCVIGNPPWERMKLQEREFFAFSAPKIAGAVKAADRRKLIEQLQSANPELYAAYVRAGELAERTLAHVRDAGNFPLTAKGDINTYMVFAELAQRIVAPNGRVGLLVPSGIATDKTTSEFFGELVNSQSLIRLYDFENKAPFFPDVHRAFKFSVLVFGGTRGEDAESGFRLLPARRGRVGG